MKEKYLNERYEPPEVEVLTAQVEIGFYGTYPSGGGRTTSDPYTDGGATAEEWTLIYGTWD